MDGSTINYEILAREALRSVVKSVLKRVAKDGLPGEHHFYISFHTTAPGVKISNRISAQYPKEMTIVLQHQYWDLKVEEDHFEVRLSFANIPELLVIPYSAIKVFFDPSVPYGLQFDQSSRPEAVEDKSVFIDEHWHVHTEPENMPISDVTEASTNDKTNIKTDNDPDADNNSPAQDQTDISNQNEVQEDNDGDAESADVVSLDAFRNKKN